MRDRAQTLTRLRQRLIEEIRSLDPDTEADICDELGRALVHLNTAVNYAKSEVPT